MWTMIMAGALALTGALPDTDTTFAVRPGARIEIEGFKGRAEVRTWNRNAVRVVAEHAGGRIEIENVGAVVRIQAQSSFGMPPSVDYRVMIPARSAVRVNGAFFGDISVDGAGGEVAVETVRGDIRVRGGRDYVTLRSVNGSIDLEGARGRVTVSGVSDDVRLRDVTGEIGVDVVNGDIVLERVDSDRVEATTVNGSIRYDGPIRAAGRYSLTTHNGDVVVALPDGAGATISIATFNGSVESDWPITLTEVRRGERFTFTVGSGAARVDLESFNGTIHLRRASSKGRTTRE